MTGLAVGDNEFVADSNGRGQRPAARTPHDHQPSDRRTGAAGLADARPGSARRPTPVAASGNTPASNASGLTTFAIDAQCNIATEYKLFYRTTTAGCSSALPDPSPPAAPPANNCFKPYTPGTHAGRSRDDHDDGRADGALHRARRARHDEPRHLRHRGAVRPDQHAPWTALAPQAAVERQGGLHLRRVDRPAAAAVPHRAELGRRRRRLSRGFMVVDNSLTDSLYNSNRVLERRDADDDEGAHRRHATARSAYTLGNGCSGGSIQQNTAASIYPGLLDGIQPSCDYPDSITTGLEVTDCVLLVNFYVGPEWTALMTRPDAGADQRQEDRDQRPPRPHRLPVVEQRVRLQQQAGQLRPDAGRSTRRPARSRRSARRATTAACLPRWSTTR